MAGEQRGITEILLECKTEFALSSENGDNKRKLVKLLQEIASSKIVQNQDYSEIENFLQSIWNNPVLLEDCILVSGLIYAKINSGLSFNDLFEKSIAPSILSGDWVSMALIRGFLSVTLNHSSDDLNKLEDLTVSAINEGISSNRIVLIARNLENLLQILSADPAYKIESRGDQIIQIISRTLRLSSDLTDYKSRDLIKFHLNLLKTKGTNSEIEIFSLNLLDCLPDMNKASIQVFDSICDFDSLNSLIHIRIFKSVISCLSVKGGLGSAAAQCIAKLLGRSVVSDSGTLLNSLIEEIMAYSSSKEIVKIFKMLLIVVNEKVKEEITKLLLKKGCNSTIQLLTLLLTDLDSNSSSIGELLSSGDEFLAMEAFSVLCRDSVKKRRKPSDPLKFVDLELFQQFMDDAIFSGSVDFRQKVSVSAKAFYEQIFARIYHLVREVSKKPREAESSIEEEQMDSSKTINIEIDREALNSELENIFKWLGNFVKYSLVEPFDFCTSNFGSVDFAFIQILAIFTAFQVNATLVAANTSILSRISEDFQCKVVNYSLISSIDNFVQCVGKSTYDSLRTSAIEIICKCALDASIVPLNDYIPILGHPRAINNEGAARIVLLHSRLSRNFQISTILDEIESKFELLKADFPSSLHKNNINGTLLLSRFLLQERLEISQFEIERIIKLSIEISEFASVIASHPSPEGLSIIPIDNENDEADDVDDVGGIDDNGEIAEFNSNLQVSNQYILSFSWRAIKETSLLLECIIKIYSNSVSKTQVQSVSEHFIDLLLKLRHCGAFRALQAPLCVALRSGYTFSEKMVLLENVLEVCLGTGQITTTRRSAGLPFLVLSLAHSCCGRGNELIQLLNKAIPSLLKTATYDKESIDLVDLAPSIIHAFNIIRTLVRDSRIAVELGSHMASIAELCLSNFNSSYWNVRNASAMLLSSLIARIFGPKHFNDLISQDHHVDLREIEVKFEGLVDVITAFLEIPSETLEPRIAYPLLAVLERIRIPPQERFVGFKCAVLAFLLKLLSSLEKNPQSGRKLAHVMGRTVFSLLHSKSFAVPEIIEEISRKSTKSTPNGIYNYLIIIENVLRFDPGCFDSACFDSACFDSECFDSDLLPPFQSNWHPILIQKYHQIASHKSFDIQNFPVQMRTPAVNSEEEILHEITKSVPNLKFICENLTENLDFEIILQIIERFKLNEEILSAAVPILCKKASGPLDERFKTLLTFYSKAENNENLRFILISGLVEMKSELFKEIPHCIFNLILDDEEEIRTEICKLMSTLNPARNLRKFITSIGASDFEAFLDDYEKCHKFNDENAMKLFQKEPLNLFIDLKHLRQKFIPK